MTKRQWLTAWPGDLAGWQRHRAEIWRDRRGRLAKLFRRITGRRRRIYTTVGTSSVGVCGLVSSNYTRSWRWENG
jgi:hypothetical protein